MSELVSVIVPIYKSEKYLTDCIDSICLQTYTNLEILLIDDGSPDECPYLCDMYAKKDDRIKVIHKKNEGVSSARNMGIDIAKGTYICFVDSDDKIPNNAIELLCNAMQAEKCEYVAGICGINDTKKVKNVILDNIVINLELEPQEFLEYLKSVGSYSPYAKLFKSQIVKKYKLRYDISLKCSEDALFIRQYLRYCNEIILIPHVVYKYNTHNDNSLSKKRYEFYATYYIKKLSALEEILEKLSLSEDEKNSFMANRVIHGIKISVWHYLKNWKNENMRRFYILNTLEEFRVWLMKYSVEEGNDDYCWWNQCKICLETQKYLEFYKWCKREYRISEISSFYKKIRRIVKK